MLKKLLIAVGALIAVVLIAVIVVGVFVYLTVDKGFVETRMAEALNRQVTIEKLDVGIFSAVTGIEVKGLAVSNFKTPGDLSRLQGQPVDSADLFVEAESLQFKMRVLPLLKRQFVLQELALNRPVINLSKNSEGVLNIDDLIQAKEPGETRPKEPDTRKPEKPLSVDDLPVALAVGEIGMRNGTINYHDGQLDQTFQVYNLTALLQDIQIDPRDLADKGELQVLLDMGIKTVGPMKSGSVESFDVTIDATGTVIPFDIQSRLLDPEVFLNINLPDGTITGLEIFNAVAEIPVLGNYLGQHISFLEGTQQWRASKESGLDVRYKGDEAEITRGRLDLQEASLLFNGTTNLDTRAVNMNLDLVMIREINDAVKESLTKSIESAITSPEVRRYVDSQELAAVAMQPLINEDGRIEIQTNVGGTMNRPAVRIIKPRLSSIGDIVREAAGSIAKDAAREKVEGLLKDDQKELLDDLSDLLRRRR